MEEPGATRHSSDVFYARNNRFLIAGPKGFMEHRILPDDKLFVRVDLPGVTKESLTYTLDMTKKWVTFRGEAPMESPLDETARVFLGAAGLMCNCCVLVPDVLADVRDGVVRMLLNKRHNKKNPCPNCLEPQTHVSRLMRDPTSPHPPVTAVIRSSPSTDLSDECGTTTDDHPFVLTGSKKGFGARTTEDGWLLVRVDMPGVAKEDTRVWVMNGEVRFLGKARTVVEHDSGARDYLGSVPLPPSNSNINKGYVRYAMKNGVLRIKVPPAASA